MESESVIDHEEFILRRENAELAAKRKALNERLGKDIMSSVKKNVFSSLLPIISLFFAMILCAIAFRAAEGIAYIPFAIAGVLIVVAAVLHFRNKKKEKSEDNDPLLDDIDNEYGALNKLVRKDLDIPEEAVEIEIFTNMYSDDDAEPVKVYTNDTASVFEEKGKLCFFYGSVVIGFELSDLEAVVRVEDQIVFDSWCKDVPYDRGSYMQYKIKQNKIDEYEENYSMTGYYSLRFTHLDTPFEVIVPLYDIEPLLDIIKIKPIEE
jgi:hypothetical protein